MIGICILSQNTHSTTYLVNLRATRISQKITHKKIVSVFLGMKYIGDIPKKTGTYFFFSGVSYISRILPNNYGT